MKFSLIKLLPVGLAIITGLAASTTPTHGASCTPPPTGLVGWWKGDGNAEDSVLGNNGVMVSSGITTGLVNQAFVFAATNAAVRVPASSNLNVGLGEGLTVEGWIYPKDLTKRGPLVEWNNNTTYGTHLFILAPGELGLGLGNLFADVQGTNGQFHRISASGGTLTSNTFQHVALTYDKSSGVARLFCNGTIVAEQYLGSFTPQTSYDLYFGRRPTEDGTSSFNGLMDEISLFNRALSTNEIAAIYNAGSAGKCALTPTNICTPPSAGLVAWWQAEGNATDSLGSNHGSVVGALTYANGLVGQAFAFDHQSSYITVPAASNLDIGTTGSGFTIESWIKPDAYNVNVSGAPIIEWDSASTDGLQFWSGGELFANIVDTSGNPHTLQSAQGLLVTNNWQHVALTYDQSSGAARIYLNGNVVASNNIGTVIPQTTYPVNIGRRTGQPIGLNDTYGGLMDELSLYNRALSQVEIAAIYNASSAGKCVPETPTVMAGPITNLANGHIYYLLSGSTWTESEAKAVTLGGHLVTVNDAGENAWVLSMFGGGGTRALWIGLNDAAMEGSFTWASGDSSSYRNWSTGEPNNYGDEDCAFIGYPTFSEGTWNDQPDSGYNPASGSDLRAYMHGVVEIESTTAATLLNVDFGTSTNTTKTGKAAAGMAPNDFWNFYSRDDGAGGWKTFGSLTNLQNADGTATTAGLTISNAPGMWASTSADPMYASYIYPFNGSNVSVTITNLPAGVYDVLPYSPDAMFYVAVGAKNYGTRTCRDTAFINPTVWAEGVQYARFTNVQVNAGQSLRLIVRPGVDGVALISGLQIALSSPTNALPPTPTVPFITQQPTNQTVGMGGNVAFSAIAQGAAPLYYQWRFNGTNLSGATNSSLTLTAVQAAQAGGYALTVTNFYGSTVSSNAVLTIIGPVSTPVPAGLVAWWQAENNALDSEGTNHGTLGNGVAFGAGKVGEAFWHAANSEGVRVPANSALDIGLGDGLTIECWIKPLNTNASPLVEWKSGQSSALGVHFWSGFYGSALYANLVDVNGVYHILQSAGGVVQSNVWQHVALSYDRNTGVARLFCDGAMVKAEVLGNFTPRTSTDLYLGKRPAPGQDVSNHVGGLDEVSLYSRALSTNEIAAIYNAGSAGKSVSATPAVPAIFSFTPAVAATGTVVAISGTNFSATASANLVYFGAVRATVASASPTNLLVAVPTGATYAPITVNVGGLQAASSHAFEPTFIGDGSPISSNSLAAGFNLAGGSGPVDTVIADLDGDGRPDLASVNIYDHTVSVFRNLSTNVVLSAASFAPRMNLALPSGFGGNIAKLQAADVDGDGRLDILACEDGSSQVSIFKNLAIPGSLTTNSFASPVGFNAGNDCRFATAADMDADGRPDLIAVNYGANTISLLKNLGPSGSVTSNLFAPPVNFACAGSPLYEIGVADLDGDGKPDLAIPDFSGWISVFRNTSTPGVIDTNTLAPRFDLPAQNTTLSLVTGDLDGDGRAELIACAYLPATLSVYRNLAQPGTLTTNSFAAPAVYALAGRGHEPALADFNGDGKPDIAAVTEISDSLAIFQNIGTGSFTTNSLGSRVDFAAGRNAWGVSAGDLNGDGRPDVAFANAYDSTITIYQNQMPFGTNPPAASLLVNGGFENPAGINSYSIFSTEVSMPGWVVESGTVEITGPYWQAAEGTQSLDLNGIFEQIGTIYQDFATIPGRNYKVRFAYAGNPEGAVPALKTANAFWGGQLLTNLSFDITGHSVTNMGWVYYEQIVTATSASSRVRFQATSPTFYGLTLDDVSVTPTDAVPPAMAPFITQQPTNQTVVAGSLATLSVTAQGTAPLYYQWSFNGTNLNGATEATLTLSNVQPTQAGNYAVLVTNLAGSVSSSNAALTVIVLTTPPTILAQTPSQVVLLGNLATFSVTVDGALPMRYFWQRNGVLIPNATNASYAFTAQLADSGSKFSCLVTNAFGAASSTNAALKVLDTVANDLCSGAIIITNGSYTNLQSTLKASAFGDPVPGCVDGFGHGVWYQFTAPVNGQLIVDTFGSDFDTGLAIYTGACDALTEAACNDDTGGPASQIIIRTTAGTTYSILAGGYGSDAGNLVLHLTHLTPPAFAVQPENQSVAVGSNVSFGATLTGALPMGFQWSFDGVPLVDDGRISGAATANLIVSNLTTADAGGYTLTATNFLGSADSAPAVLTVLTPPTITLQPIGRSVPPGLPTTFTAGATGNPAPSYQWLLNGTNISGATSSSFTPYTIAAVGTNQIGNYQLVASNLVGVTTSAVAQLTFGVVAAWGRNVNNECLPPPGLTNVIAVAGTYGASFAVRTDGTIAAWGSGAATNIPASASNVVALASYGNANYALRADGRVVGLSATNVPPLTNIVALAAGATASGNFGYALRAEGSLTHWGSSLTPAFPAGLNHLTAIAAGYNNAIALKQDGTIVVAGGGPVNNVPAGLSNVVAVAVGNSYALALKADGRVVAWGTGMITNLLPSLGLTNIVAISAGNQQNDNYALAIRADGRVVTWGSNLSGQSPPPAALNNLVAIAGNAAPIHGLALVNDGRPIILSPPVGLTAFTGRDVTLRGNAVGAAPLSYQWLLNGTNVPGATNAALNLANLQFGDAGDYQLLVTNGLGVALSLAAPLRVLENTPLTFLSQTMVSATNVYQGTTVSFYGGAVLGSGPLRYQWFSAPTNQNYLAVPGATNDTLILNPALAMQSGYYYLAVSNQFLGLTSAPVSIKVLFARAWGYQASNPPVNVTNAIAVATGGSSYDGHYFALGANGRLTSWINYYSSYGEANVAALSNSVVTAIAAGSRHSLALKSDGTVYAWGYGSYGQTNSPAGLNSVVAIACGSYHDLALKADGTVVGWGAASPYNYGQTTNHPAATNVVAIAAGDRHNLALRADGTLVGWGYSGQGATVIPPTATNIVAIAAGTGFSVALRANGTVVQWGSGMTSYPVPANLSNVVAISSSSQHCTALKNDGTVVSWGNYYSLTASSAVPADLANVIAIASGGDHDLALFGTRAPAFTVQPWNRTVSPTASTAITLAGKCAGVQPMSYQWQLNGTNLPSATNDTLTLINQPFIGGPPIQLIQPGNYQIIASNPYGVTVSKPAKVSVVYPLAEALDTMTAQSGSRFNWFTSGSAQWFGQTNITHDGVDAARSGAIGAAQETILQTTVATNWAGRYTFWWKVSSEEFFDTLEFRVNGVTQASISGEVNWQPVSIPIAAGTNVLQWRYSKDGSYDVGQDAAWVDQFMFLPNAPVITGLSASQIVNQGSNLVLSAAATGAPPLRYQWRQNGLVVGNSSTLALNNVGRAQNGTYFVTVTNDGGSTASSNLTVKVLVPQVLGSLRMLPDGTLQLTSGDAGGGAITPADLANFEVQFTTNLVNWATLPDSLSLTSGTLQLQDNGRTNSPARFYRIIEH